MSFKKWFAFTSAYLNTNKYKVDRKQGRFIFLYLWLHQDVNVLFSEYVWSIYWDVDSHHVCGNHVFGIMSTVFDYNFILKFSPITNAKHRVFGKIQRPACSNCCINVYKCLSISVYSKCLSWQVVLLRFYFKKVYHYS